MDKTEKTDTDAASAALVMRVLAVQAARTALSTNLKAARSDAVERAWTTYDTKLAAIWDAYDAAIRATP